MMIRYLHHLRPLKLTCWLVALMMPAVSALSADNAQLATQIERLVRQLNAPQAALRDEAEQELIALGKPGREGAGPVAVLTLLPEQNDRMPPEVRHRLTRVRQTIEQADAEAAVAATRVTLTADQMPLSEVFAAIEQQTGNRLLHQQDQFGQEGIQTPVTIDLKSREFWPALDAILDQSGLTAYTFSGEDALVIRPRDPDAKPRLEHADYSGPFRIAAQEVHATRNLLQEGGDSMQVIVQIAWEPRLQPIRISQSLEAVTAVDEDGGDLTGPQPAEGELEVPVNVGSQAAELRLMFPLPPRSTAKIARLAGKLDAVVPGRTETFRFGNLDSAEGVDQRRGGVTVTLDRVRRVGAIYELHMRVRFDEAADALASHRGWVLQNASYLVAEDGTRIEHVGFETTHQSQDEMGLAYLFELPQGRDQLDGLVWEYNTPAAIIELPIDFELADIQLP